MFGSTCLYNLLLPIRSDNVKEEAYADFQIGGGSLELGTQRLGVTAGGEGFNIGCQPLYRRLGGTQWEP